VKELEGLFVSLDDPSLAVPGGPGRHWTGSTGATLGCLVHFPS
jgi:hypothetical protein